MRLHLLVSLVFAFLLMSCTEKIISPIDNPDPEKPVAGSFGVSKISGLSKSVAADSFVTDDTVGFDVGDLKSSNSYYFILSNTGTNPIESIQVAVTKSLFEDSSGFVVEIDSVKASYEVTPSKISILQANLVTAALRLSIQHGRAINGYGYTKILNPGVHAAEVLITGKTKTFSGVDTTVSLLLRVQVNALVVEANLYAKVNDTTNIAIPMNGLSGAATPMQGVKYINGMSLTNLNTRSLPLVRKDTVINGVSNSFNVTPDLYLTNTGNTSLSATVYTYANSNVNVIVATNTYTIPVDSSMKILSWVPNTHWVLSFGSGNVTTDPYKLPQQADGNFYVALSN